MAYERRNIIDGYTIIDKDHYDNLQDGIDTLFERTPEDIGAATPEYVERQIALITETGIPKLLLQTISEIAEEEGQTVFPIKMDTFDHRTDTVRVFSGITRLSPNGDFTVDPDTNSVVLTRGVPLGRVIDIEIYKNIPIGEDGSVSGKVIAAKTLPIDRLEINPLGDTGGVHNLKTFTSLEQIGITTGSETIADIVSKLPNMSILVTTVGSTNSNIYPYQATSGGCYGLMEVTRLNESRIIFEFWDKATNRYWSGRAETNGVWTGWDAEFISDGSTSMTGGIKFSPSGASVQAVRFKDDTGQVWLDGGSNETGGACIILYGKDNSLLGRFLCRARSNEKSCDLVGNADGTLTWSGKKLIGEHNPEVLATMIQNIISSGEYGVGVKSIQKGDINIASGQSTATATIKSVNPDKAVVIFSGYTTNVNLGSVYVPRLDLSGNTIVLASLSTALPSGASMTVPYQVIEYV